MKLLVVGGHGFIGSHITEKLCSDGHDITVLSRGKADFFYPGAWVKGDYTDNRDLEILDGFDGVVHCASATVPATSAADPLVDINCNLVGTIKLLDAMVKAGVFRLIYLSSGGTIYGNTQQLPITENHPLNPISAYGAAKVAIEKFIHVYQSTSGLKPIILRPSNPIGERQSHMQQGLVSTLIENALKDQPSVIFGDGSNIRDYIYVKDLANLAGKAVVSDVCGIFNVGFGRGYSIRDVISMVEEVSGHRLILKYKMTRNFDVSHVVLDTNKAKNNFHWHPEVTIDDAIARLYKWKLDTLSRGLGAANAKL